MWPVSQKACQGKESQSSGPGDKLNNEDGCEGCGKNVCSQLIRGTYTRFSNRVKQTDIQTGASEIKWDLCRVRPDEEVKKVDVRVIN